MEHNAIAKSKETFFQKLGHFGINGPGLNIDLLLKKTIKVYVTVALHLYEQPRYFRIIETSYIY